MGLNSCFSSQVNGKSYKTFIEQQSKIMKTWILPINGAMFRIVLEKDTLDIWVNGKRAEVAAEFTDEGYSASSLRMLKKF